MKRLFLSLFLMMAMSVGTFAATAQEENKAEEVTAE